MDIFKIICLGAPRVGKTATIVRFVYGIFLDHYEETVEDCYKKIVSCDGNQYRVHFYDLCGNEEFTAMRDLHMMRGNAFILMYDVQSEHSFDNIRKLYRKIIKIRDSNRFPIILVASKCDYGQKRTISEKRGQILAAQLNASYLEVSAKDNIGIGNLIDDLMEHLKGLEPIVEHAHDPETNCCVACSIL